VRVTADGGRAAKRRPAPTGVEQGTCSTAETLRREVHGQARREDASPERSL
jgi:hypothetical protein